MIAAAAVHGKDAIDHEAIAAFVDHHGEPKFAPVCIVIAAYREAATIAGVLAELPDEVLGRDVSVLVVDDGSGDGTAELARDAGAFVCAAPVNRGQGAALRLGYRLAGEGGAEYVVTTDADGQYDPADIERVLGPVADGRADFASGSRRLGRTYQRDGFRRLGVRWYAWVIRRLTGRPITDPSFGLRAMRVEVPQSVTLHQPQFQASELLLGVILRGYRTTEVPATMRERGAGRSRKGPDLVYGARFGWVVVSTWWRERRAGSRAR
jgi:glycosyltransferase involved in cell wall biosynthesis